MKLELYYFESCPFCQMVLQYLNRHENKDKVELKDIMQNAEFRTFHVETTGRSTVPCLYIDGEPLFESQDILKWLGNNL